MLNKAQLAIANTLKKQIGTTIKKMERIPAEGSFMSVSLAVDLEEMQDKLANMGVRFTRAETPRIRVPFLV